jgi:hypothetical protein
VAIQRVGCPRGAHNGPTRYVRNGSEADRLLGVESGHLSSLGCDRLCQTRARRSRRLAALLELLTHGRISQRPREPLSGIWPEKQP